MRIRQFSSVAILVVALFSAPSIYAVGIPITDIEAPLKVSESTNYRCSQDGQGLVSQVNGDYRALKNVTCHDDHLWQGNKVLSYIDMLEYSVVEYMKYNVN